MRRHLVGAYGLLGYLAFLLPIGYLVGFLADVGAQEREPGRGPRGPSLAIDLVLLALFGLQHSTMARPGFKVRLRRASLRCDPGGRLRARARPPSNDAADIGALPAGPLRSSAETARFFEGRRTKHTEK